MNRIGDAKGAVTVATRPFVRHAITFAADAVMLEVQPDPVDGDEIVDSPLQAVREQVPRPTQVSLPFLTDVADEIHGAGGLHVRALKGARNGQHHGETATVIPDARTGKHGTVAFHPHVGAFGKDGVEMAFDEYRGAIARAAPLGDDVSDAVDMHACNA